MPPPPCQPLKLALPHTALEQSVLADELTDDGPTSQAFLAEYVGIRARGDLLCPAPK